MGSCKSMTDTLAPVERTNWALLAWNSTLDQNDVPSAWLYGQDHLAKIDAHLRKNRLKRPKIKQGTTSKVNCILFNRLLSPVLLNKTGLVRAKAGSFTLKTLNGCHLVSLITTRCEQGRYSQRRSHITTTQHIYTIYVTKSAKTGLICTKYTYLFYHIYLFFCKYL